MNDLLLISCTVLTGLFLAKLLPTAFHEFGHGIFAGIFTKGNTLIYIGSLGDPTKCLSIKIGKFIIYIKYNPMLWNSGLCVPGHGEVSLTKQILLTAGGPLMSLILSLVCFYLLTIQGLDGTIKAVSIFIMISSFGDFLNTISVNENPITLYDGSITYNDGKSLRDNLRVRRIHMYYFKIGHLTKASKFTEAEKRIDEYSIKMSQCHIIRMY
jgi:hypothetical protein